jgi:hypothetical protein
MIGTKERHFAPFVEVSLEDLVPAEHFYRHLERTGQNGALSFPS